MPLQPVGHRSRKEVHVVGTGVQNVYDGTALLSSTQYVTLHEEIQDTSSSGHQVSKIGGLEDIGGFFQTMRVQYTNGGAHIRASTGPKLTGSWYTYTGPFSAYARTGSVTEGSYTLPSTPNALMAYGTQAIARCLPTNPLSGLGQFLGELHELPKPIDLANWQAILRNLRAETKNFNFDKVSRKAADEYLNHVFGWVPLLSDIQSVAKVVKDRSKHIRKYLRGANHRIHRSYGFPGESSTTTDVRPGSAYGSPAVISFLYKKAGTLTTTVTTTRTRWFKGAFTYHLPVPSSRDRPATQFLEQLKLNEQIANRLLGTRMTPDLLWKLTPWSWAAGWVSTANDVVHNWSAFQHDGLVMHYGYIMETTQKDTRYSLTGVEFQGMQQPVNVTDTVRSVTKVRQRATPYGFGLNPSSFTGKQWAVIAALGISKQPLSLNF